MVDPDRLWAAYETARCDLLAESTAAGHWIGESSSSVPATAIATSALALVERHAPTAAGRFADENRECQLSQRIMAGVCWLGDRQNADGGWGDVDKNPSNIASTLLVRAAFALTAVPADCPELLESADSCIRALGSLRALVRRSGKDKMFSASVLVNCAMAGLVPWRKVPALPFERICLPQRLQDALRPPLPEYSLTTLLAIGQAAYCHRKPLNPLTHLARHLTTAKSLRALASRQTDSGGFMEDVPLTGFVVMALAGSGYVSHPIVERGVEFLLRAARSDGSWPIHADRAVANTTLAVGALAAAGEELRELRSVDWLLACRRRLVGRARGVESAGWSWTNAPGGVPETLDTCGALLALAACAKVDVPSNDRNIRAAARAGVEWLLEAQNDDGGWPMYCRGDGDAYFDRSASELTSLALRAINAWQSAIAHDSYFPAAEQIDLERRIAQALYGGWRYLAASQEADGHWKSLWVADPACSEPSSAIYATTKVLMSLGESDRLESTSAERALAWLVRAKHDDGSWGGTPGDDRPNANRAGTVEETAWATEALLACGQSNADEAAGLEGARWLIDAVESNHHLDGAPVGLSVARIAYCDRMLPLAAAVAALGRASRRLRPASEPRPVARAQKIY